MSSTKKSRGSKARNPVIDLAAEDISPPADTAETEARSEIADPTDAVEEPVSPPPPPPPPPPKRKSFWTARRIAAASGLFAALLGIWLYREFGARWWPPSAMSAIEGRLGLLETANRTLNEQLVALGASFDGFKADVVRVGDERSDKVAGLETRLGELDKALGELRQTLAAIGTGASGTADPAALADITRRVGQLEQAVAALSEGRTAPPATGLQDYSQLTQALSDLRAKFQAGLPFRQELDRIAVYVPQNTDFADLEPYAGAGIENAETLGSALEALVPSLPGPASAETPAAEENGFWDWLGTVVEVRDLDALDWPVLAKSAAADAKAGHLEAAIARLEAPGAELPPAVADWRGKARQRLEAQASLARLAAAVTRIIMGKS